MSGPRLEAWVRALCAALELHLVDEGPGLLRAELSPEQLAELDGKRGTQAAGVPGAVPEAFFREPGWTTPSPSGAPAGLTTFYWRVADDPPEEEGSPGDRDAAAAESGVGGARPQPPPVEWLGPGSERLEKLFALARRRGALARRALAPAENGARAVGGASAWRGVWLFTFELRFGGRRAPQAAHVAVEPEARQARVVDDGAARLADRPHLPTPPPGTPVGPAPIGASFERAYPLACDAVVEHIIAADDSWAIEAALQAEKEVVELERYYRALAATAPETAAAIADERERRLTEVRERGEPRVQARLVLAAYVVAPAAGGGEPDHAWL